MSQQIKHAKCQRKLDFGLLSVDPVLDPQNFRRPHRPGGRTQPMINFWTTHGFSFTINLIGLFYFGLLGPGKEKCFVTVFLSTSVVLAQSIDMEAECLTLVRLISKLYSAGALGRGRDPRFARDWHTVFSGLRPSYLLTDDELLLLRG